MPPFGEKTPLRGRALRALLAALALAVALIAPSALLPQTAFSTTASELGGSAEVSDDEPWLYASREDTSDVAGDDLMSATHYTPSFNVFDFHFDFGLCVSDFLYGLSAQAASVLSSWADEFMAQISTGDMFDVNLAGGDYASAYRIVLDVAERVVVPVSGGFLGLAFVFSLMSFGRDAGMGGRHGTDLFASYAWIAVKYLLVQTAIVHGVRIMRAIFEVVNDIGAAMQDTGLLAGAVNATVYHDAFMESFRSITFSQGGGTALIMLLVALVVLIVAAITAIYVQVVVVVRVFEVCVRMVFSGFAFVMLANQSTRESGVRYIKQFAGVCVQALVVLLVVGLGSVFIRQSVGLFTASGPDTLIASFMSLVGPMVSCIVMFLMVKQSREIANAVVGA